MAPRAPNRVARVGNVRCVPPDQMPPDPFAGDPEDPSTALGENDPDPADPPLGTEEQTELLADLADLAVYQALLEPRGVRGIVVDCVDCGEAHYHDWDLLRASLEQLLHNGKMRPHEPAYDPSPNQYVTWEYCRGFVDGVSQSESHYPKA